MKFSQAIDNFFIGRLVQSRLNIISHTDPNRIYVENIRSFFKIPFTVARFFCEMAVKQGMFTKHYGIECPNKGNIIKAFNSKNDFPNAIHCDVCEALEEEKSEFEISECKIKEFYRLNIK